MPAFTPAVVKFYCTTPSDVFFSHRFRGETRTIACSSGVQQVDPMGAAMFCLALRRGLKCFRMEFEGEGMEAFAYMDDASLGLKGVTANTVRAFAFLPRGLDDIGIVVLKPRQDRGTSIERARPDGRGYFRSRKALMPT